MTKSEITSLLGYSLLLVGLIYSIIAYSLAARLKKRHSAVWESLGRPSIGNASANVSFRFGTWALFDAAYRSLHDRIASVQVIALRFFAVLLVFVVGAGLYLMWS